MLEERNINTRYSDIFVREPVDKVCHKIEQGPKRIVLGGYSTGKSVVLRHLENRNIAREKQFIAMEFDSDVYGRLAKDEELKEKIYRSLHEFELCFYLLQYIRKNYSITYNQHFSKIKDQVSELYSKFSKDYIDNISNIRMLNTKEISPEIINKMTKLLAIDSLSIGIIRFDWTNFSNPKSQRILEEYFDLFDQVIITTDDFTIMDSYQKLIQYGYTYMQTGYNTQKEVVKEIISQRIQHQNCYHWSPDKKVFPVEAITLEDYQKLIKETHGNMFMMLHIVSQCIFAWHKDSKIDIQETLKQISKEVMYYEKESLKDPDTNYPKLYIHL